MRYNKAHTRIRAMIDAMPRRKDGHVRVCRNCQRWTYFAGCDFNARLAQDLTQLATWGRVYK